MVCDDVKNWRDYSFVCGNGVLVKFGKNWWNDPIGRKNFLIMWDLEDETMIISKRSLKKKKRKGIA